MSTHGATLSLATRLSRDEMHKRTTVFALLLFRFGSHLRAAAANEHGDRAQGQGKNVNLQIVRPMSLSSRQAAPIVVLHGGPSVSLRLPRSTRTACSLPIPRIL
jgi:poly(3-hydroxybutyrate) depolymerase